MAALSWHGPLTAMIKSGLKPFIFKSMQSRYIKLLLNVSLYTCINVSNEHKISK